MSLSRIKAIILQELYITYRSLEVIVDLFYFSIVNIVVFGFVSVYLAGDSNSQSAYYLLLGMILWEVVRITQYSISVGSLWNIWSRNLSNMFVAPLSLTEYMIAEMVSGIVKAAGILIVISLLAFWIFGFNLLSIGLFTIILVFINLTVFAWAIGILILAFIFRYGTRIQALAWGLIFIFQPLSAAFFPVEVLPEFMQKIAYLIPATYVFESARDSLDQQPLNMTMHIIAFGGNILYLLISLLFFNKMFNGSKETGQFARNEG